MQRRMLLAQDQTVLHRRRVPALTSCASRTCPEHDYHGNTTVKQEAAWTTYYQYDHENSMTRIDFADDSHSYFAYDADSKRVEKRDSAGD